MPPQTDTPIVPDANAQAKAALPQPDYMAPAQDLLQGTKVQKAYDAAQNFLSEHAQHFSDKVLKPFREELDSMGEGLQTAGETGHTPTGGQLTEPTRALASGVGTLLKAVPVGKDVKDTVLQAVAVPPELEELGVQLHPEQIIKDAGLVYKKELTPGSGVHMFEHPDHPGLTASLHESEFTPENVQKKMQSKLDDFGVTLKPKQVAKNASGDSAASQEALNRGKSQAAQGITHVRRDTRSGKEIPLNSIDAVDAKAGPYEQIVQKHKNGETIKEVILDSGAKARPLSGQSDKLSGVAAKAKSGASFSEGVAAHHEQFDGGGDIALKDASGNSKGSLFYRTNQKGDTATVGGIRIADNLQNLGNGRGLYEKAAEDLRKQGFKYLTSDPSRLTNIKAERVWDNLMKKYPTEIEKLDGPYGTPKYRWNLQSAGAEHKIDLKISAKPAQKTGVSKEDSKLASDYLATLKKQSN